MVDFKKHNDGKHSGLRKRAEKEIAQLPKNTDALTFRQTQQMLHELQVHQTELNMQNEELRKSRSELEAERMRYFELYNLAPMGYITVNKNGLILEANLATAALLGQSKETLINQPISNLIFKKDHDIYYLHRKKLFETCLPQTFDLEIVKKDRTAFWAQMVMTVIQNDPECPDSCQIIMNDVSAHRESDNALKESEKRFIQLAEQSRTVIWEVDSQGMYTYISSVSLMVLGYRPDELVGRMHFYDLHPEFGRAAFKKSAFEVFAQKQTFHNLENTVQTKDGLQVWLSTNGLPLLDNDGRLRGYRGSDIDITERKKAEAEKADLESWLRQSRKMETLGQLASGISHDFNNLLSVIIGYADILRRDSGLKVSLLPKIEAIIQAGERASSLTRKLLMFSRRQLLEPRIIDLNEILVDMEKMLHRLIKEDIILKKNIDRALFRIKADPVQIEQVIMNMVINASDAMPAGGTLTIETGNVKIDEHNLIACHRDIKPGLYAMISVSDTGCGMDDKTKEHIFEPFFTTKEIGKGTGLGLSTVYGVVKESNAYIDVQSEIGKGARFRIYFPQAEEEGVADVKKQNTEIMLSSNETILLVDDEDSLRRMLCDFLQSIGYTVLSACNGKEALKITESHKGQIHILLTDIVMPGMDGFELARRIKGSHPEIKLIFMSGHIKPTDTHKMMRINNNLIDKPINLHSLSVKIREILERVTE